MKEFNKRGDVELKKAEAIINKHKDMKAVRDLMQERDTYLQQSQSVQAMLRSSYEEVEKYKKLVAELQKLQETAVSNTASLNVSSNSLDSYKNHVDSLSKLSEEVMSNASNVLDAESASNILKDLSAKLSVEVSNANTILVSITEESKNASGVAVVPIQDPTKVLIASEELKSYTDKIVSLEKALEHKIRDIGTLKEEASNLEAANAKTIETLVTKINDSQMQAMNTRQEMDDLRAETQLKLNDAERRIADLRGSLEETKKRASEEIVKANERAAAAEKVKKQGVDEAIVVELKAKLESTETSLQTSSKSLSEAQKEIKYLTEEVNSLRDKISKREQKLTVIMQEKSEITTRYEDLETENKLLMKKCEKLKKDVKSKEESLKAYSTQLESTKKELETLQSNHSQLVEEHSTLTSDFQVSKKSLAESQSWVENLRNESNQKSSAINQLEQSVLTAENRIEEMKSEFNVAVRKTKQLNRDLRLQLAAERRKITKLERTTAQRPQVESMGTPPPRINAAPSSAPDTPTLRSQPPPTLPVQNQQRAPGPSRVETPTAGSTGNSAADETIAMLGGRL
jgi:chromosome segregation ATPase